MADKLHDRATAVENQFFARRDQELLAKLREEMGTSEVRSALSAATGIEDKEALDALIEHQIKPQTMVVVGLIPMVAVAWSDGVLERPNGTRSPKRRAAWASRKGLPVSNCWKAGLLRNRATIYWMLGKAIPLPWWKRWTTLRWPRSEIK